jgi:hypothetical protein
MQGFLYQVQHASLGGRPLKLERVYVVCDGEKVAPTLIRAALGLSDEAIELVRPLPDSEWQTMGLKPYQVKRA